MMTVVLVSVAAVIGAFITAEVAFRVWYRRVHGRDYFVALKFRWGENHVVPHPFLTFAYRKNGAIVRNQQLPYALRPNRYYSFKRPLRLNSIGHFGPNLPIERKPGSLRVACLGSSGVANNIADESRDYCWPSMLQERLASSPVIQRDLSTVEVMNCGIGGWTMIDVFVDFAINTVHYRPDWVVIYQGLNDLPLHLMDDYALDYSHGRRNLGEVMHIIKRGYWFPKVRWWHSYEFVKDRLVGTGNIRNEVLERIEIRKPDYGRAYRPLTAEEMALRHLLVLCRAHGIRVIVGSYVFYDHNGALRNRKLREGVELENAMFRRLATEFELPFLDLDGTIAKDREHFVDAVHFSPAGMQYVADSFAAAIVSDVALAPALRNVAT
jgi:lysophospholipase L1-like esterase